MKLLPAPDTLQEDRSTSIVSVFHRFRERVLYLGAGKSRTERALVKECEVRENSMQKREM